MRPCRLLCPVLLLIAAACADDAAETAGGADAVAQPPATDQWWSKTHLFRADQAGAPMLCGVGRGASLNTGMARTKAQAQARTEAVRFLQISISQTAQDGQTATKTAVDTTIQGLQIVEHHQEGRDAYALACIDLATLGAQNPWKEQPELVAALEARAKQNLGK